MLGFLAQAAERRLGPEIAELGGKIRRESKITLPDALIAATALWLDLDLASNNRADFGQPGVARGRDQLCYQVALGELPPDGVLAAAASISAVSRGPSTCTQSSRLAISRPCQSWGLRTGCIG